MKLVRKTLIASVVFCLIFDAATAACAQKKLSLISGSSVRKATEVFDLWPSFAPGETTKNKGAQLPARPNENPPATRIKEITQPQIHAYLPKKEKRIGVSVLIFPGGGYNYVVVDKEGSEIANWLNELGIAAFVVRYRTKTTPPRQQKNKVLPAFSERPLQDGQRAVSLVRKRCQEWNLEPNKIGVLGFSAGGQLAALVTTRFNARSYRKVDSIDSVSCRPDFSMLLYPWRLVDDKTFELTKAFPITKQTPSTFLAHVHTDPVTPLNSAEFYIALKKNQVDAELHIYRSGKHGSGLRKVEGSSFSSWSNRAEQWMQSRGLIDP